MHRSFREAWCSWKLEQRGIASGKERYWLFAPPLRCACSHLEKPFSKATITRERQRANGGVVRSAGTRNTEQRQRLPPALALGQSHGKVGQAEGSWMTTSM